MCGIVGLLNPKGAPPVEEETLRQMLGMIRHRGPDQFGIYRDERVGLGAARLSIVDLHTGQQPIANEDSTLWIVFNGEIFNYLELRRELESGGHRFSTHTDTEVVLHLYEDLGPACLERLNGQFAIAIWDARTENMFLARDRLGIRPLFYTIVAGVLIFGSEIKAILADARVSATIDPLALEQTFTFWNPLSPRTIFRDIVELPPGHFLQTGEGAPRIQAYWEIDFSPPSSKGDQRDGSRKLADHIEEFSDLLVDATRLRLRADVPVGAYLSGGLDSSTIASIVRNFSRNELDTFSIAFHDADYDESEYQNQMARLLGTKHQVVRASHADIGRVFPEVVWHTEVPLMRTAPAPMFMLSKLVRDCGYKVVLTGEGADEFLAGYDIYKEAMIRRFWARNPTSTRRPLLLRRLYRDIPGFAGSSSAFLAAFFGDQLTHTDAPWYSHFIRWRNNRRACRFLSEEIAHQAPLLSSGLLDQVKIPGRFARWGSLARAQYLEIAIFLSGYLLSSQGDRVAMGHSVEGRFPFLDCRVVNYCNRLPENLKLRGLNGKYLLKQCARKWLPEVIWRRPKHPYRAPVHRSFFGKASPEYVRDLCSRESLRETGLFKPAMVGQLFKKMEQGRPISETDDMALAGIISSQLVFHQFVKDFRKSRPLDERDHVRICGRSHLPQPA